MISPSGNVSAIIPSLSGKGDNLLPDLAAQTQKPDEVMVIKGVQPNGKARNQGVAATSGEFLFFIDDDATPGSNTLIENLIKPLVLDNSIGVCGAARVLPGKSSWFQRRAAAEIPRIVNPVPDKALETNPPLDGYGHSHITTTCCVIRRSIFELAGRFNESLTSGVDTDLFYRIRKLGYRFILSPDVFVFHPAPSNIQDLWKKYHWYGIGYGQETQLRPEQRLGPRLPTKIHRALFLLGTSLWFLPNIFILYSYSYPKFQLGFRPLKALSTYAVAWGYTQAWKYGTP